LPAQADYLLTASIGATTHESICLRQISPMSDLPARLEALLRIYAAIGARQQNGSHGLGAGSLVAASDGHGGTLVVDPPPNPPLIAEPHA
jgi:hypothetical protein